MKVILKSRMSLHYAVGEYDGTGIRVLKGSKINPVDTYSKMPQTIKQMRHDQKVVSEEGTVLQDVYFDSPSPAAIFVTGRSSNGYIAWRIDDKISLKKYRDG